MILWRAIQKDNFKDWKALVDFLELDTAKREHVLRRSSFAVNLPRRLAEKIEKNCLEDPILRQFVPLSQEEMMTPGFCSDPVEDQGFKKTAKLLHKYEGRALLVCSSSCAMHCRYCFRQNYPYERQKKLFEEELTLISQDTSLSEIILSGGDPLSLSDHVLETLLHDLAAIPHVERIRFHTRFPIGIPERIDASFIKILSSIPKQVVFIIHVNHARELDGEVIQSLKKIQQLGIPILNQAVLLRGVNDNVLTLKNLLEALINIGVVPYYLHQLDRVQGAAHFEVDEKVGIALIEELRKCLPGYAIPHYVREVAGELSKSLIR